MMSIKKNQGAFIKIDLGNEMVTYGRILKEPYLAFYDIVLNEKEDVDLVRIGSAPILFTTAVVAIDAIESNRWILIGKQPLEMNLQKKPVFCSKDLIDPNKFFIITELGQMVPVSKAECIGRELAIVWQPEHIEERLKYHFFKTPFKWQEYLPIQ